MDELRAFAYKSIIATRAMTELELDIGTAVAGTASWRPREAGLFPDALRREAARMARLYEVFYCLERTVRDLVRQGIKNSEGAMKPDAINPEMLKDLERRRDTEIRAGFTPREGDILDFATLGELSIIIDANWDSTFHEYLPNREAVKRLLANLNTLRSPMAHSIPIPVSEATRLGVFLADWFRQTL